MLLPRQFEVGRAHLGWAARFTALSQPQLGPRGLRTGTLSVDVHTFQANQDKALCETCIQERVLNVCKEELRPLVKRLRNLFFYDRKYTPEICCKEFLIACQEELAALQGGPQAGQ